MRVIPVLDLRGGMAVHARGGERHSYAAVRSHLLDGTGHVDGDVTALAHACRIVTGDDAIYVADLDAITGGQVQWTSIGALAAA
ncbi:MAG: HisA/HisF-related TIM barrel protein, partial [Gemmatimonadaceae bacterium]